MPNKLSILIVSYFFQPDKKVGALRTSYWYKHLPSHINCKVSVLTATPGNEDKNIHLIPDKNGINKIHPIKDVGVSWRKEVKNYVENNFTEQPNLVIISGSPFMHFSLSKYFKLKFNCKVILDYRDPFANNPAFKNNPIKVAVKRHFEKQFNKKADALITVNAYCGKLITYFDTKPNAIIQNGFDESFSPDLKPITLSKPSFSYTGKFYFDPTPMLNALEAKNFNTHIVGPDKLEKEFKPCIKHHGFVTYTEAVNIIASNDVGIIQTYGEDFQSTTKIFDYVRCKRAILIISNKYLRRGSIYNELKDYPNVFWCNNEQKAIESCLEKICRHKYEEPNSEITEKFSRKNQLKKLVELINSISE